MTNLRKTFFALAAALSLVAIAIGARTPAKDESVETPRQTVFRNVRLFDGVQVTPATTVVIEGSKIVSVGGKVTPAAGSRVIDGKGKTLLPGLIDSHTHTFDDALGRALQFGVTTQIDMFTHVGLMQQAKRLQSDGKATGRADLVSAGTLMTAPGGHGTQFFPIDTIRSAADVAPFIEARVREGSDFIKVVYDDGSAYGTSFPSIDSDSVRTAISAAHKHGKKVVFHVSTLERAKEVLALGADGLVHTFGDAPPDAEVVALAKKAGAFVVPTLTVIESTAGTASGVSLVADARLAPYLSSSEKVNLQKSFPVREGAARDLEYAFLSTKAFSKGGVPILAGSDAPNPGTTYGASMHRELELLVTAGLTPSEALAAATSVPARMFSLDDRGLIKAGMRADLLLVEGDPTKTITDTRNIAGIWKEGVELTRSRPVPEAPVTAVAAAVPSSGLISDFESGEPSSSFGSGWVASTDTMAGGKSEAALEIIPSGFDGSKGALAVAGNLRDGFSYPWAGAMFSPAASPMQPVDLSAWKAVSFRVRGDNSSGQLLVFATHLGRVPASRPFSVTPEWKEITVSFQDLRLVKTNDVQAIFIGASERGPFRFEIDDVRLR